MDIRPAISRHAAAASVAIALSLLAAPLAAQQQQPTPPDAGTEPPAMTTPAPEPGSDAGTALPATDPAVGTSAPEAATPADAGPDTQAAPDVGDSAAEAAPGLSADSFAGTTAESPIEAAEEATPADPVARLTRFLVDGGPAIWAIAALAVLTLALILWKIWRFFLAGVWSRGAAFRAAEAWQAGDADKALALVAGRKGTRSRLTRAAIEARLSLGEDAAREEVTRAARRRLAELSTGLRALELIATIAPLLGLLGTVLGMIEAFQTLQNAGSRADPSQLAGGIWEALLTTAAGMAVAIPASAALTWFESVRDSIRGDMEDIAARIFIGAPPRPKSAPAMARAAE
ncbi:MotA/TolQ/ExbB proton channel family protein [Vannielia litorea]|nr:MotA/TolQ/ExbB proton channel family protein [Vannielia litorea]